MRKLAVAALVCMMATMIAGSAGAVDWTLLDGNTQLDISNSATGEFNWIVDGTDHLYAQWWYYRLGTAVPGVTNPIDALTLRHTSLNEDAYNSTLALTYGPGAGATVPWEVTVTWSLLGGADGSGSSDVSEQVRVNNYGPGTLNLALFEYNDFDLNGTSGNDYIMRDGPDSVVQWDGAVRVRETSVKTPDYWQIGVYNTVASQIASGNNLTNAVAALGPVDATWAYQWNLNLLAGRSDTWSKNKRISTAIPEWNSLFLAAMGMVGTIGIRRRRR